MRSIFFTLALLVSSNFVHGQSMVDISEKSHCFIQITDTEIFNTSNWSDWVDDIKKFAHNQKASFIIHTGDICYENGLRNHIELMNSENMGLPMKYCIGNHDFVKGGEALFEQLYGPIYYSFDVGNVHYVVTPMAGGDNPANFKFEDFIKWLKDDLDAQTTGKPIIIFNHDLLIDKVPFDWSKYNLKAWVYGHWHINYVKKMGGVMAISTSSPDKGGIDHSVAAFRKITVNDQGDIRSELIYPYLDKHIKVAKCCLDGKNLKLSVNGYNTPSPITKIIAEVKIGNDPIVECVELTKNSDWNFSANVNLSKKYSNVEVALKAFFNDNSTKDTTFIVRRRDEKTLAKIGWVSNLGSNIYMCSPIVYGGDVFVATVDENFEGKAKVVSLNALNGNQKWSFTTRNSVKNSIAAGDEKIFAQDAEGWLYALNAKTGALVWQKKLEINSLPALVEGLTFVDGVIYAGTGKGMVALTADGKQLWRNSEWGQREGTTSTIVVANDVVLSGAQWGALYANDAKTGKLLWHNSEDGLSDRASSGTIVGDTIYIVSRKSLFIMELKSGKVIQRIELPFKVDVTSNPLVFDRGVAFGSSENGLVILGNDGNLKTVETYPALVYTAPYTRSPAATVETSPILFKEHIIYGASDGCVRFVNKNSGKVDCCVEVGAPILTTPIVLANSIFIADYGGNVYQITLN